MDLAYLKAHPEHLPTFLTHQRIRETPVSGGSICTAQRLTLDDGASVFAKSLDGAPSGFFAAEAAGLRWLREAGAVSVPEVIVDLPDLLALEWIDDGAPTAELAERFGRELAGLHRAGADAFGAPWPGFIGSLSVDNTLSPGPWHTWFAERRLLPLLRLSHDRGALGATDVSLVEAAISRFPGYFPSFAGSELPARIHGDLWPGNVLWGRDRVWLIDPAAHGGHRETDLANLQLWGGVPQLERVLAAYDEAWPLSDGWQERAPGHQLFLLLAHTAMFGVSYRDSVLTAARKIG